jgi:hypothetical protein
VRTNGRAIVSNTILLNIQLSGMTAKSMDATRATLLPYHLEAILYTRKVSYTARNPIKILGVVYRISIDCISLLTKFLEKSGYPIKLNIETKKICPK